MFYMTFIFLLIIPETIIAHGSLYLVDTDNLVWIIRNIVILIQLYDSLLLFDTGLNVGIIRMI